MTHYKRYGSFRMDRKHSHPQYELYYLLSGSRNYFIEDRVYPIQGGDLVLVNANTLHKTIDSSSDYHERILIEFDSHVFDSLLIDPKGIALFQIFRCETCLFRLNIEQKSRLESRLFQLIDSCKKEESPLQLPAQIHLLDIMLLIHVFSTQSKPLIYEHPSKLHKTISEIIEYIHHHYQNELSLELLSQTFSLSKVYISRSFKQITGFSYIEYLNDVRIREAKRLLAESKLSIEEISSRTGFYSSTHFGRIFRSISGITPGKWRKNNNT